MHKRLKIMPAVCYKNKYLNDKSPHICEIYYLTTEIHIPLPYGFTLLAT